VYTRASLLCQGDDRLFLQELLVLVGGFEDQQAGTFDGAHLLLLRGLRSG
jgi:hypothetical protein